MHYLCDVETKNLYIQGAEDGVAMGVLLTATSLAFIYGGRSTVAGFIGIVLACLALVLLYKRLRRHITRTESAQVAQLWTLGIVIMACGSIICGAVTYVWLEYVEPTFIYDQAMAAIEAYDAIPELSGSDMVATMRLAIDEGLLPSAIEFVVNMIMLTVFTGSLASLIMAAVLKARGTAKP